MAIGMTYEQYWYGDPLMVRAFYKAEKLRRKIRDEEMWMQGIYMVKALEVTVGNMFLADGKPPFEYPEKPFTYEEETQEREKTEEEEEQEALWAEAWMTNFVLAGQGWGK